MPNTACSPEKLVFFPFIFQSAEKRKTGYHNIVITGLDFPNYRDFRYPGLFFFRSGFALLFSQDRLSRKLDLIALFANTLDEDLLAFL